MPLTHGHFADCATHAILAGSAVATLWWCLAAQAALKGH